MCYLLLQERAAEYRTALASVTPPTPIARILRQLSDSDSASSASSFSPTASFSAHLTDLNEESYDLPMTMPKPTAAKRARLDPSGVGLCQGCTACAPHPTQVPATRLSH